MTDSGTRAMGLVMIYVICLIIIGVLIWWLL